VRYRQPHNKAVAKYFSLTLKAFAYDFAMLPILKFQSRSELETGPTSWVLDWWRTSPKSVGSRFNRFFDLSHPYGKRWRQSSIVFLYATSSVLA